MSISYRMMAGSLILIGAAQFIVGMMIAEALYTDYSIADNYISDLGVGSSALIFNSSVWLFGLLIVAGAYCIMLAYGRGIVPVLFFLAGVGAMGVGMFPETFGALHGIVSMITFVFGGLSAIAAFKFEKAPLNYISVIMGLIGLVALALFASGTYLGLGRGGMERMIAYPLVLWSIAFGGHLLGIKE
jgi:hypothetical membrane protein